MYWREKAATYAMEVSALLLRFCLKNHWASCWNPRNSTIPVSRMNWCNNRQRAWRLVVCLTCAAEWVFSVRATLTLSSQWLRGIPRSQIEWYNCTQRWYYPVDLTGTTSLDPQTRSPASVVYPPWTLWRAQLRWFQVEPGKVQIPREW